MISNRLQASGIPGILPGSGLALALSYYNYGLSLDPKHVHLHTNLGSLLKDIGQLDLAIQMYEQAVSCDGTFDIALTNLANAVKDRGRTSDAIAYYKRAVLSNPDFAEAVCGLFTALNSVCDWRGRGGLLLPENEYDRWHVDDDGMLVDAAVQRQASGLTKKVVDIVRRQLEEASTWGVGALPEEYLTIFVSQLQHARAFAADDAFAITSGLRSWSRNHWEGSRILRFVERSTKAVMRRWYCDTYILDLTTRSTYNRPLLPPALTVPSAPTVLPFHTFTCPLTAQDVRMISQRNALRISCSTLRAPWLPRSVYRPPPPPSPQLNVGYVSSDFNNHPLAHLMQSVFGFHEKTKVKALCYATTASDGSVHRLQIEREAPVFRDASSWPSDRIIEQIVADEIHILVNLNGYTRGARNEIFAARPAPIQMSFMGFAGTLGAEWCDYILADTTAIPPSTLRPWRGNLHVPDVFQDQTEEATGDWIYSENVIFCRDTFFCCDHAQSCSPEERHLSWEDEQRRRWQMRKELFPSFSDDTVILGNFNQLYKRNALRISCSTLRAPWLPRSVYRPPPPPSPQLNVGYVSSDFNNHPLAHLMQSVFGFHEKNKVKAYCYATTASDGSVHRLQIEREAPVFRDASSWPSDRIVQQIVTDEIHILVNLNGYTRGARNEIFAARPAPIQMSFMGFAGTLGAEWCDYILADTTAIPPSTLRPWRGNLHVPDVFQDQTEEATGDWIYSENVIFCRDTFFCCDHAQSCSPEERQLSWEAEQRRRWQMRKELFPSFSDDTVILGNFNQLYKIDPSTFRSWLRILSRVPKAVLWLLRFPELGETNLKRTAKAWAGAEVASRIIFTDVAPKHLHIARARVCDLFLDTPECNAHTTAADVLWSSTPLLTFPRYSFKMCSRMAASILKGALPKGPEGQRAAQELIASSDEEYESLAIRLASSLAYNGSKEYGEGAGRLAELRYLLWRSKWSCALFDTRRWVADLELAYQEAWRRWVAGEDGDIYL
ncbi:hypothetical protein BN1708_014304 [Verticillium longisporum]|uniref:protein O-GlcNAc transferase n=1 Tax=Verticillium longisporum TaxID=100787 RepID=A0A0G4LUN9_VERLO|nr:hypothetical protein BN1708_014304 [Verticillium longisporum]